MALVLKDRVKEGTTTSGTGTVVLNGAATGYQSFAVIGNANTTYYTIAGGSDYEVGIGTYYSGNTSLSRDTILASSNANAAVTLSGSYDVFVTYPAEVAVYLDGGNAVFANGSSNVTFSAINVSTATINTVTLTTGTISAQPNAATDIVNKTYVDSLVASGIHFHQPVRVESPTALVAVYNQPNGAGNGVGATLTNSGANVSLVVDGVSVANTNRVLVYTQSNAVQNGVYVVSDIGSNVTSWILTRSDDTNTYGLTSPNTLGEGSTFFVQEGDTGAGETYTCNTPGVITFGTSNITFTQISSAQIYSAGTGLALNNTTFSISNTAVTAGTYGNQGNVSTITVNAQGQLTNAVNTAIVIPSSSVTGLGTMATQNATSVAITGGSINGTLIGNATPSNGAFTTISASGVVSGVGFANYLNSPPSIGGVAPNTGAFTTLSANGLFSANNVAITGGAINGTLIGNATPSSGAFTTLTTNGITTLNNTAVISANSATSALRITQLGTGNALLVEDETNPDASPFVINADGRVILGDTSANAIGVNSKLQISGTAGDAFSQIVRFNSAASGNNPGLTLARSRGTLFSARTAVQAEDALGQIGFFGDDGTNWVNAALIQSFVDGTPGTNDMPGRLVFSTTADGASTPTERMRISNSGNVTVDTNVLFVDAVNNRVGVGTTSPASPLTVAGVIESTTGGVKFPDGTTQTTAATAGALAAGNNSIIINNVNITANATIAEGQNGFSVGPITTANGVSVTIASGQQWVVI